MPTTDFSAPHGPSRSLTRRIRGFFAAFLRVAFDPYHPEAHYMRGPGPACAAKAQLTVQPIAVSSQIGRIAQPLARLR